MFDNLFDATDVHNAFWTGAELATVTLVVTIVLELLSIETAKAAYHKDKRLYLTAVGLNFWNHYVYGIPVYMTTALLFLKKNSPQVSFWLIGVQVACILVVHSLCYYEAHRTFHSCPGYYKYHKFHHRFNTFVPPMSANAVGLVEYLVAYVLPFAVACGVVRPYEISIRLGIYIVSMTNLSIHTPKIEAWSERNMPAWLVSTHDHLEHHRKLNVHYAAPTVNIDWIVAKLSTFLTPTTKLPPPPPLSLSSLSSFSSDSTPGRDEVSTN